MSTYQISEDPETGRRVGPTPPSLVGLDLDLRVRRAHEALAEVVTFVAELPEFGGDAMERRLDETMMRKRVLDLASELNYMRAYTDSLNEWVRQQKAAQATEEVEQDA